MSAPCPQPAPRRVVILATPTALSLGVAGPVEVFAMVAFKLREAGRVRSPGYAVGVVSAGDDRRIESPAGLTILARRTFREVDYPVDTLLVAGGMDVWSGAARPKLLRWVREQSRIARRFGSVCTGAFVLAATGLLDGRRVTTHWYFCQQLQREYPKVVVDPEPIFIREGNLSTSAGVTSGLDLAMVEEDFGRDIALRIARGFVLFLRRAGGQHQFSTASGHGGLPPAMMNLSILYRGPLASCNYGCGYCPFAKHAETPAERSTDTAALARFEGWVTGRGAGDRVSILFTPWGEALVRRRYRETLTRLSHLPQVEKVAAQTNLACGLDWLADVDRRTFALWVTYHPTETSRARFRARCARLDARGIRYSVGVVGLREHVGEIEALRRELSPGVYLWVNAFKRVPGGYSAGELARLAAVDPLFPLNVEPRPSLGKSCRGGAEVISVDGDGTMRRCHFIKTPIGNLYEPGWEAALRERPCVNATCGCHIGYVHLDELHLRAVFGPGLLERIPAEPIWQTQAVPTVA